MSTINWLRLGMNMQDVLAFVNDNLYKFAMIDGGVQIQASYWGITLAVLMVCVYRGYLLNKISKLRLQSQ